MYLSLLLVARNKEALRLTLSALPSCEYAAPTTTRRVKKSVTLPPVVIAISRDSKAAPRRLKSIIIRNRIGSGFGGRVSALFVRRRHRLVYVYVPKGEKRKTFFEWHFFFPYAVLLDCGVSFLPLNSKFAPPRASFLFLPLSTGQKGQEEGGN